MSEIIFNSSVTNQFGAPSINENTLANRPSAGQTGRLFVDTTNNLIYRDNGTSWDQLAVSSASSPGGSSGNIQYNNAGVFGGSANNTWDNANQRLTLGGGANTSKQLWTEKGVYFNCSPGNGEQVTIGGTANPGTNKGQFYVADTGTINELRQNVTTLYTTTTLSYGSNFYILNSGFLVSDYITLPRINSTAGYIFYIKNNSANTISIYQNAFDSGFYAVNSATSVGNITIAGLKSTCLMANTTLNIWTQMYLS